ncbi:hypothetical protein Tco_0828940 [Tanacetum coccineum]
MRTIFSAHTMTAWFLRANIHNDYSIETSIVILALILGLLLFAFAGRLLQSLADGQPFAVIALGGQGPYVLIILGTQRFDWSWKDHHTFFSFMPDVQHRHGLFIHQTQL